MDDHQRLAAAIVAARTERERTADMVCRARELVASRFTLERMVSAYAALYDEVLEPSLRPLPAGCDHVEPAEALRPEHASHHVR